MKTEKVEIFTYTILDSTHHLIEAVYKSNESVITFKIVNRMGKNEVDETTIVIAHTQMAGFARALKDIEQRVAMQGINLKEKSPK